MTGILCTVFGICALYLGWRLLRFRKTVRDLEAALRERRRLLLDIAPPGLRGVGLRRLIDATNQLIDQQRVHDEAHSGYSDQVEATLGAIQEAVIVFDEQRVIEFANDSAKRLFQQGRPLKGMRLESCMRSASLLDFLNDYRANPSSQLRQIRIERGREDLWFEASCAEVGAVAAPTGRSTLLVLHDITRLKNLEMMRRDFVANVSHELRTPLTIIKGFAETLSEDGADLPAESRRRFLDKIVNNAQRLHVLVEDLLTLSRLESKPEQITPQVQALRPLLEDTAENARDRIDPEKQAVELHFDEAVGEFAFDRFRLQQVFDNLVENIFRYAPEFTRLRLRAELDGSGGFVHCVVADDGPGMSEKDVPHIFERFYRVDKGRSRERGGTGLGLSITKHIVQLHGGTVYAESKPGEGTAIHFHILYSREPKVAAPAVLPDMPENRGSAARP